MSLKALVRALLLACPVALTGNAHAVNAEPTGMDESTLAKMARARAKAAGAGQTHPSSAQGGGGNASDGGLPNCGVNIGNSINSKPGRAPKEIIVVVQGDVINSNNKCK